MLELIFALLLGCGAGIITGLLPGLHVNTVAAIVLSALAVLTNYFSFLSLGVFLVAMLITHSFLDLIPSIFLGAPDDGGTVLSVLPGHQMLLKGEGYKALKLTIAGGIGAYLFGLLTLPVFLIFLKYGYAQLEQIVVPIIISFSILFMLTEKKLRGKTWALLIFLLSGTLGLLALNNLQMKEPLFPLLAGLFGLPTLLLSAGATKKIPEQRFDSKINFGGWLTHVKGAVCAALMSVLPALGSAQATILAQFFSKKRDAEEFLVIVGGINTVSVLFVLTTLYLINKSRTGVIAVMKQFLTVDFYSYSILLAASFAATGIAIFLTMVLGRYFANRIWKIKYRMLSLGIFLFIIILIGIFSGILGLFILSVATAVGLLAPKVGVKRIHAMGCLVIPVVAYFL